MADRIDITDTISIAPSEIELSFVRASGPGGQNVNKVATAAQLRFDIERSVSIPGAMKRRASILAGSRLTGDGTIVITASTYRTQQRNREDAIARLVDLLRRAAQVPKTRRKTRPTLASKRRRLDAKTKRGAIKRMRSSKPPLD